MIELSYIDDLNLKGIKSYIFPTKTYALYVTLFLLSLLSLSLAYVMAQTSSSFNAIYQFVELISYFVLVFSLTKLIKVNFVFSYFRMIAILYLIWQFFILFRGDFSTMDYFETKQFIFDLNYGGFIYIVPLFLFINFNLFLVKKIFDVALILSIVFAVLFFLNFSVLFNRDLTSLISQGTAENYFKYLALPIGILALNFNLQSNKIKIVVVVVILMVFLVGIIRARRGMLFMISMISLFGGFNYFITSNKKISIVFYLLYFLIGVFIIFYFTIGQDIGNILFFNNVTSRGLEDTRGYVETCFYNDMSTYDWIFGKGSSGGYKCSGIDESVFKNGIRTVIETDYLQLIMYGGFINILLLFLIMIPAIILGLFYSNNNLIKTLSIWILLWLLFLYPSNVYSFSFFHISVWFSAGICYSKPLRELPDSFISKYFLSNFTYIPDLKKKYNA
jgi:hypothetical protein